MGLSNKIVDSPIFSCGNDREYSVVRSQYNNRLSDTEQPITNFSIQLTPTLSTSLWMKEPCRCRRIEHIRACLPGRAE